MGKFGENPRAQILWEHNNFSTGALAVKDVASNNSQRLDGSTQQGMRILKVEYNIWTTGMTAGEGPVLCGLAGPDISASEIEEALEADPQWSGSDTEAFQANRPIWPLGMINNLSSIGFWIEQMKEKKINWSFPEGTALQFWVYNLDDSTLSAFNVHFLLKIYGVWLND